MSTVSPPRIRISVCFLYEGVSSISCTGGQVEKDHAWGPHARNGWSWQSPMRHVSGDPIGAKSPWRETGSDWLPVILANAGVRQKQPIRKNGICQWSSQKEIKSNRTTKTGLQRRRMTPDSGNFPLQPPPQPEQEELRVWPFNFIFFFRALIWASTPNPRKKEHVWMG